MDISYDNLFIFIICFLVLIFLVFIIMGFAKYIVDKLNK